ncbi:MAG: EpsG family protein [Dolichospermum circinale Clear-D4]|nr:EpsG family protein [Dolichospermum circinale Clear-D4]
MTHQPIFFLTLLFMGILISYWPRFNARAYQITKILLCCCIFTLYYLGTRNTNDLNVFQNYLESISTFGVDKVLETTPYEPLSTIYLWLFRNFDDGAFVWHGTIVVFFLLCIIHFTEAAVGKNIYIPAISFVAVLPAFFGEFVLNQSRQLMAASFLILCSSFLVSYSKNIINNSDKFNWKNALFAVIFSILAFLCHYSSLSISILIFLVVILLSYSIYHNSSSNKRTVRILVFISLFIGSLYPVYLISTFNFFDASIAKYSNYQNALGTYTFAVESKNAIFIQLLFCIDFIILIINNRSYSKFYNTIKQFSRKLSLILYSLGFLGYGLCYYSINSPGIQEFGRRMLYYVFVIEILAFLVSITRIKKLSYILFLTFPFIMYTTIMISSSEDLFVF